MLEEHAVIDLMRDLEVKLRNNPLNNTTQVVKDHFVEWIGRVPPLRLFEEQPKNFRNRNRDRITIILGNPSVRVIWQGVEVRVSAV